MADGNLKIGAIVDIEQLHAGMVSSVEEIKNSTAQMGIAFQEVSTKHEANMRAISDTTRLMAASVSSDFFLVAEASTELTVAQKEVRAAMALVAETAGEDTAALALLAAAKQRAATASLALASAQKVEVESVIDLRVALNELMEAFSLLLGAGIALEFVNRMKESEIEVSHLADATGVTVSRLTQLEGAMQRAGVSTDRIGQFLARLSGHMVQAAEGSKAQVQALKDLGVNTDEWHGKLPPLDQVLMQIADHMQETKAGAQNLGEGYKLLGRGSTELIAFLRNGSAEIERQMGSLSGLGDAAQKAAVSARELQLEEAQLSQNVKEATLPAFGLLVEGTRYAAATTAILVGALNNLGRILLLDGQELLSLGQGLSKFGEAEAHLNFKGMEAAFVSTIHAIQDNWSLAMSDMKQTASDAVKTAAGFLQELPSEGAGGRDPANLAKKIVPDPIQVAQELRDTQATIQAALSVMEGLYDKSYKKIADDVNKELTTAANDAVKINEIELDSNEKHQIALLNQEKQRVEAEASMGQISREQEFAALKDLEDKEYQIELQALQRKLAQHAREPVEVARINAQIEALEDAHNQRMLALDTRSQQARLNVERKALLDRKQLEETMDRQLTASFSQAIAGMIDQSQSFSKSLQQMMTGIAKAFASMLVDMAMDWVSTHILMKVFGITTQSETNAAKGASNAALAASGAFALWSGVAFPPVPETMAAAALAEGMGFAAAAGIAGTAAKGAYLDKDMPIWAHAGEMILPKGLSDGLSGMITSSSLRDPVGSGSATAGGLTAQSIAVAVRNALRGMKSGPGEDDIARAIEKAMNRGKLRFA